MEPDLPGYQSGAWGLELAPVYTDEDTHVGEKSDSICIVVVGVERIIFIFFICVPGIWKSVSGNLGMGLPVLYLG